MKDTTRDRLKQSMQAGKYYSRKEVLNILCASQSTTAEYLMQDVLACGYLQQGVEGYKINQ